MNLSDLELSDKKVEIIHPENEEVSIFVNVRHEQSHEYNSERMELSKNEGLVLASAIAQAATISIEGIDDFDNSKKSISDFYNDPRFFWVAAKVAEPYLIEKKSGKGS